MKYIRTYIFDIPDLDYLNELDWRLNDKEDLKYILDKWNIEELIDWKPYEEITKIEEDDEEN